MARVSVCLCLDMTVPPHHEAVRCLYLLNLNYHNSYPFFSKVAAFLKNPGNIKTRKKYSVFLYKTIWF